MSGPAVTAERHGRKSMARGRGCASEGIAWWKSLLGRINGSSNTRMPTAEPGKTTHTIHTLPAWQWGSPAAQRWVCTARRNHLWWFVDVLQGRLVTKWGKSTLSVSPPLYAFILCYQIKMRCLENYFLVRARQIKVKNLKSDQRGSGCTGENWT